MANAQDLEGGRDEFWVVGHVARDAKASVEVWNYVRDSLYMFVKLLKEKLRVASISFVLLGPQPRRSPTLR